MKEVSEDSCRICQLISPLGPVAIGLEDLVELLALVK